MSGPEPGRAVQDDPALPSSIPTSSASGGFSRLSGTIRIRSPEIPAIPLLQTDAGIKKMGIGKVLRAVRGRVEFAPSRAYP